MEKEKIKIKIDGTFNIPLIVKYIKKNHISGYINKKNNTGLLEGDKDNILDLIKLHNSKKFSKKHIEYKKEPYIGNFKNFYLISDPSEIKLRIYMKISGLIQNNSIETIVKRKADTFNIKGWIKKNDDDSIDSKMEGQYEQIYSIIDFIKNDIPKVNIENIQIEYQEYKDEFKEFNTTR